MAFAHSITITPEQEAYLLKNKGKVSLSKITQNALKMMMEQPDGQDFTELIKQERNKNKRIAGLVQKYADYLAQADLLDDFLKKTKL